MSFIPSAEVDAASCFTAPAPQNAFAQSNPDYEYESDIVDQCGSMMDGLEHQDIPQRPCSRLGFHSPPSDNYVAEFEDPNDGMPETVNWPLMPFNAGVTHSRTDLASTTITTTTMAYDLDEDITAVASAGTLQYDEHAPLSMHPLGIIPNNALLDTANPFSLSDDDEFDGSDSDSDCSSCENSDEDFEFSLTSITLPLSKSSLFTATSVTPVARATTPSTRSPLPADLKSIPPMRPLPPKPSYSNHGYSRHALLHLKWFWAVREVKWAEDDAQTYDSKAYGGITGSSQSSHSSGFGPLRSPTQRNLAHRLKLKTPLLRSSTLPPMSVHPRRGDIASLRDPYSMHIDRCFVNIPSWTLAKTMYMFDLHVGYEWQSRVNPMGKWSKCGDRVVHDAEAHHRLGAVAIKKREASCDTQDDVDVDSENESLATSASVASSDDSDATLVESENEGELERDDYSTFQAFISGSGPSSPSSSTETGFSTPRLKCSSSPASSPTEKPSLNCPFSPSLYAQMPSRSTELLSCLNGDTDLRKPWATNWYRRWEILLDLVRSNWDQHQMFAALSIDEYPYCADQSSCSTSRDAEVAGPKGKRRLKRQPRFYFEDENSSEDNDRWEWDSSFDLKNMGQISEPKFGLGVHSLDGSVLL